MSMGLLLFQPAYEHTTLEAYRNVGVYNYLWVSDSDGSMATWWYLYTNSTLFRPSSTAKTYGLSVRCLED